MSMVSKFWHNPVTGSRLGFPNPRYMCPAEFREELAFSLFYWGGGLMLAGMVCLFSLFWLSWAPLGGVALGLMGLGALLGTAGIFLAPR